MILLLVCVTRVRAAAVARPFAGISERGVEFLVLATGARPFAGESKRRVKFLVQLCSRVSCTKPRARHSSSILIIFALLIILAFIWAFALIAALRTRLHAGGTGRRRPRKRKRGKGGAWQQLPSLAPHLAHKLPMRVAARQRASKPE